MAVSGWLHLIAETQHLSAWPLEQQATHIVYIVNIGLADHLFYKAVLTTELHSFQHKAGFPQLVHLTNVSKPPEPCQITLTCKVCCPNMLRRGKCINITLKLYKSKLLRKSETHYTFNFYFSQGIFNKRSCHLPDK